MSPGMPYGNAVYRIEEILGNFRKSKEILGNPRKSPRKSKRKCAGRVRNTAALVFYVNIFLSIYKYDIHIYIYI